MIVKFFQTPFSLAKVAEKQGELKKNEHLKNNSASKGFLCET